MFRGVLRQGGRGERIEVHQRDQVGRQDHQDGLGRWVH